MELKNFLDALKTASVVEQGLYWEARDANGNTLLSVTPCYNFRTKSLLSLISDGHDIHLVRIVVQPDLPELSKNRSPELREAIANVFKCVGYKQLCFTTNGLHFQQTGSKGSFEMNSTEIISYYEGSVIRQDELTLELTYRGETFTVLSRFLTSSMNLDCIQNFALAFLPDLHKLAK